MNMRAGLVRLWIAATALVAAGAAWHHVAEFRSFADTFNLTWDRDAHNQPIIERYSKCIAGADERTLAAQADECRHAETERIIPPTYYPWKWAALVLKISLACAVLELAFYYVWLGFKRKAPR